MQSYLRFLYFHVPYFTYELLFSYDHVSDYSYLVYLAILIPCILLFMPHFKLLLFSDLTDHITFQPNVSVLFSRLLFLVTLPLFQTFIQLIFMEYLLGANVLTNSLYQLKSFLNYFFLALIFSDCRYKIHNQFSFGTKPLFFTILSCFASQGVHTSLLNFLQNVGFSPIHYFLNICR